MKQILVRYVAGLVVFHDSGRIDGGHQSVLPVGVLPTQRIVSRQYVDRERLSSVGD